MSVEELELATHRLRRSLARKRHWISCLTTVMQESPTIQSVPLTDCSHGGDCPEISDEAWQFTLTTLAVQVCKQQLIYLITDLTAEVDAQSRLLYLLDHAARERGELQQILASHGTMDGSFRQSRYDEGTAAGASALTRLLGRIDGSGRDRASSIVGGLGQVGYGVLLGVLPNRQVVVVELSGTRLERLVSDA